MASEKQLRANRENAKRSTGPKTAAGRLKSSRNALRHGLSVPLSADPAAAMKACQIAQLLAPEAADDLQAMAAGRDGASPCPAPARRRRPRQADR